MSPVFGSEPGVPTVSVEVLNCIFVTMQKWKKVWCILYRESSCSISRLEFYECKDGGGYVEKTDRILRKQQESKKVKHTLLDLDFSLLNIPFCCSMMAPTLQYSMF